MDGFKVINFFYSRRANLFNHVFDRPKDEEWICISCVKKCIVMLSSKEGTVGMESARIQNFNKICQWQFFFVSRGLETQGENARNSALNTLPSKSLYFSFKVNWPPVLTDWF